ncbi:MAG: OstA family protein, partial [Flavisolibacter sp.]|nr:OstA family protein [Flavisolibacter sp.]
DSGIYNQVKATRMDGFLKDGSMDSVRARGSSHSVYFIRDEDSAYSGINEATSDIMDVLFKKGDVARVIFRRNVKGTVWPLSQKSPDSMKLENFQWLEARRPKTKYALFE